MKIKKNILTDRILKISIFGIIIQMAYAFLKDTSTQKIKCARGVANIHDELMSNVLDMLRKDLHLTMRNIVK